MGSLATLLSDPGSTTSSYMAGNNCLNYQFQWIYPFLASDSGTHDEDTHEGKILMHIKLKIKVEIKNILENSFDSSIRDKICVFF